MTVSSASEPAAVPRPAADGAFRRGVKLDGITLVTTEAAAKRALAVLERHQDRIHAWDTETTDLALGSARRRESPVTHGRVLCATCYCGDDVDFGSGPLLFVDNDGPAAGLLGLFKGYFEDAAYRKVFHNYSFDRHMLKRHGIALKGFEADTLHMARLYDTSLAGWEGAERRRLGMNGPVQEDDEEDAGGCLWDDEGCRAPAARASARADKRVLSVRIGSAAVDSKIWAGSSCLHTASSSAPFLSSILDGEAALRAGKAGASPRSPSTGKLGYGLKSLATSLQVVGERRCVFGELFGVHPTAAEDAHNSPELFPNFARYSTSDAELTFRVFHKLKEELSSREWTSSVHKKPIEASLRDTDLAQQVLAGTRRRKKTAGDLRRAGEPSQMDLYSGYLRDLGDCLADLEEVGIGVDRSLLEVMQAQMEADSKDLHAAFVKEISDVTRPDGERVLPDAGGFRPSSCQQMRTFLFGGAQSVLEDSDACVPEEKEFSSKAPGSGRSTVVVRSLGLSPGKRIKEVSRVTGLPSVNKEVLRSLAGDLTTGNEGAARRQLSRLGYPDSAVDRICRGLRHLADAGVKERALAGSMRPLLAVSEATGRIHPSWMFDTATGRLACRNPNLQNLPKEAHGAYRLRGAFKPGKGMAFIIADYAQLELCVLAHIANCQSMIDKLGSGGDYHSEVAAEMFPEIREALAQKTVVASADVARDGLPTIKERFGSLRAKAKAINFGIIYGKTPHSLAEDLGISKEEARELMDSWFRSKPGVKTWVKEYARQAEKEKSVPSLLGRHRHFPFLSQSASFALQQRSQRAVVNFGVQGSAADIVMAAMLRLWQDPQIRAAGFRLVMQVHDEFVLEGPEAAAAEVLPRVKELMQAPFADRCPAFRMRVPLKIDAAVAFSLAEKP